MSPFRNTYLGWNQNSPQNNLEYWRVYFFETSSKTHCEAFLDWKHVFALLSTGFGKSLIYQQFFLW